MVGVCWGPRNPVKDCSRQRGGEAEMALMWEGGPVNKRNGADWASDVW